MEIGRVHRLESPPVECNGERARGTKGREHWKGEREIDEGEWNGRRAIWTVRWKSRERRRHGRSLGRRLVASGCRLGWRPG